MFMVFHASRSYGSCEIQSFTGLHRIKCVPMVCMSARGVPHSLHGLIIAVSGSFIKQREISARFSSAIDMIKESFNGVECCNWGTVQDWRNQLFELN
jgi:hypothetical protein